MSTPEAPDPRKVAEAALDVFVYVPVGLALEARELLPKLAERGRNQIVLARLGARFAVQKAEAEAEKLLARLQPVGAAPAPAAPIVVPPTTVVTSATPAAPPVATGAVRPTAKKPSAKKRAATPAAEQPAAVTGLAIPGYDTLSASQVVPRLDALRPAELDSIRRHELDHRGRRTILSRIAQLQG